MKLAPSWSLRFKLSASSAYVLAFAWGHTDDPGGSALDPVTVYQPSNGTTTVTLVSAPASGDGKIVDSALWRNTDSVDHTVTVILHDGTNERAVVGPTLRPGDALVYSMRGPDAWVVIDRNMQRRPDASAGNRGMSATLFKSGTAAEAAGNWYCTLKDGGAPGAITVGTPGLSGRAVYGSTEPGTPPLVTPTGYWWLTGAVLSSSVAHAHWILDLLWVNSGIVVTTTTAQTVNSVSLPTRDAAGGNSGEGCMIGLLFTAAATNASAISNATVSYTNSDGTSGRTATLVAVAGSQIPATPVVGTLVWFSLAAGDTGVSSIQSITLGTSLVTGSVSLIIARPVAAVMSPAANVPGSAPIDPATGVCLWTDPALFHAYVASATTATATSGVLTLVDR